MFGYLNLISLKRKVKAFLLNEGFFFTLFPFLPLLLLLTYSDMTHANEQGIHRLLQQVDEKKLWDHPYWHKLLHYEQSFFRSSVQSDVVSRDYFLSKEGDKDPKAELRATVRALFKKPDKDRNSHPQCRFVSRFYWLRKVLNWEDTHVTQYNCPKYNEWTKNHSIGSISLIFATGFLGSPASFFGHPLLKFNFMDEKSPKSLLDVSVNFGAFTPEQVDPFSYALKGIFGGYQAGFTHMNFFYRNHNYTEIELRDLWEYELKLTQDQVEQIVSHTWDLLGMNFPYYFLADNCASRIAELLEMVIDYELLPRNVPYAIPHTLYDRLVEAKVVKSLQFIPSRKTRMTHKYLYLSKPDQKLVENIIGDNGKIQKSDYENKNQNQKTRILETLVDYYSYRLVGDKDNIEYKSAKRELLIERLKLPPGNQNWGKFEPLAPHQWQRPVLTRFSFFYSKEFDYAASIRLRPAYYDLLAIDMGGLPSGSLSIFDLEFSFDEDKIWLNFLDIIGIKSLNLSQTGLPGDGGMAWSFKFGFDNQNLSCRSCVVFRLEGGVGKALPLSKKVIVYVMLIPRVQSIVINSGSFSLKPELASVLNLSKVWKSHISVGQRYYLNGEKSKRTIFSWENRFLSNKTWDIRASYKIHVDQQVKLSYTRYW